MRDHTHYDHRHGTRKKMSTFKKVALGAVLLFLAAFFLNIFEVWSLGQYPKPLTYGQVVDKKNECFRQGYEATTWQNGYTLKTIGVTCNEMQLR